MHSFAVISANAKFMWHVGRIFEMQVEISGKFCMHIRAVVTAFKKLAEVTRTHMTQHTHTYKLYIKISIAGHDEGFWDARENSSTEHKIARNFAVKDHSRGYIYYFVLSFSNQIFIFSLDIF